MIENSGNSVVYQYTNGEGDDTIIGFGDYDTLRIIKGEIKGSVISGDDLILNIGAGRVTLKEIRDTKINIIANNKAETISIGKIMQGTNKADSLANSRDGYLIESFAGNDRIYNYSDEVTIVAGEGNDTIVNSGQNVVYRYGLSDGKDVITGFNDGDSINITRGSLSGSVISGNDLILNIGAGSITLKDIAAETVVNIVNADNSITKLEVPRLLQGTNKGDSLVNEEDLYQVEGKGGADKIINSGSSVTIIGGSGNDTITNTGNKNIYEYGSGDGKDTIIGYNSADTVHITKGTIKSSVTSGNDFILNIGSGSITFKDIIKGSNINLIDSEGKTSTITVPKILQGTSKNESLTNAQKEYTIQGLSGNDTITNSGVNVTIEGGKGNDVINNSANKTTYSYSTGDGKDTIIGFSTNDTLHITKGTIKSSVISGNDLILNIGSGSVTIKEIVGGTINLRDASGNLSALKVPYLHMLTDKAESFKNEDANYLVEALGGADTIENFAKGVSIDGGAGKDYIYNTGTNSSINGGLGNDSIDNFASNATINGGAGNDTINNTGYKNVYEYAVGGGQDLIIGYGSTDTLQITEGKLKSVNIKGMDVILSIGSGSVTLQDAAGKTINLLNSSGNLTSTVYSGIWEGTAKADTFSNSSSNILLKGLAGNDTITNYAATVTINGGAGHDIITLDKSKNVTVIGGAGNDTINSSSTSGVVYQYAGGDGKDVITGFNRKDTIQVTSGTLKSIKVTGGNTIVTIGSGTITLEKYTSIVNVVDKNNNKLNVNSRTLDLLEDNNFITDENNLDAITDSKFTITQIQETKSDELLTPPVTFAKD